MYIKCSEKTLSLLNRPCLSTSQIDQIHAHLTVSGSLSDPFSAAKLLSHSLSSSSLRRSTSLFSLLPRRSPFIFNTFIRSLSLANQPQQALEAFKDMVSDGFSPNNYTFSFLLKSCVDLRNGLLGVSYHCHAFKLGWESYDFVRNGLIHMYSVCDLLASARKLFDSSVDRDVVAWTAMVNGYLKNGEIDVARALFDEMPVKNSVTWSAMINGYVRVGFFKEGLDLFNDMQLKGVRPNHAGIVGALSACGSLGALDQGRWIHSYVTRDEMETDVVLGTALIDMYVKCGCMEAARRVFDEMPRGDVYAFTSMISGLANNGRTMDSFDLLKRMRNEGVRPNEVTFICILSACSKIGLVKEGLKIFASMSSIYGIEPGVEHYGCLVDLLGRAGMLEQAKKIVREMPMEPDSYVLGALLNACRIHGDVELGEEMVSFLSEKSLDHGGVHVLLSNIFASIDQWGDVEKIRKGMLEKNVRKVPGCSLIEVDGIAYEFIAGDKSHELMDEIMSFLIVTNEHLKSLWFDEETTTVEVVNL